MKKYIPNEILEEVKQYDGICYPSTTQWVCKVKTSDRCYTYNIYNQNNYEYSRSSASGTSVTNCYTSALSTYPNYKKDDLSSEPIYRNDFDKVLLIFLLMVLIIFYVPNKIFFRLFRRLR